MFWEIFKKKSTAEEYDQKLLTLINDLKNQWDHAKKTQLAVSDSDIQMEQETKLARQKYLFIYKEARLRNVKNEHIQPSVINYERFE